MRFSQLLLASLTVIAAIATASPLLAIDWPPADAQPLTWEGDISQRMVAGCDRFLLSQIELAAKTRESLWQRDFSSAEAYEKSIEPNRQRLMHMQGMPEPRISPVEMDYIDSESTGLGPIAFSKAYRVLRVRWRAFGNVYGEGLLAQPNGIPTAGIVAIPDADISPEALFGLVEGVPKSSQYARQLAERGCLVLVPTLIDRTLEKRRGRANLTNREYLYRPAYVLGRHLLGYELQKVLAGIDWLENQPVEKPSMPLGIFGWGEGGMLALYAGAVDPRIDAVCVSGYFDVRDRIWNEPISRNVFGRLAEFGDAELAAMIHPRVLVVEASRGPELTLPSEGGAPAELTTPKLANVRSEWDRYRRIVEALPARLPSELIVSGEHGEGDYASSAALEAFSRGLDVSVRADLRDQDFELSSRARSADYVKGLADNRMQRQIEQIVDHNAKVLHASAAVRREFMQQLDTSSSEAFAKTQVEYREHFANETIGTFDLPRLEPNPRIRKTYDEEKWTGYEVVLDVFPDVFAYGILLVPKDLKEGDKRPVVVCQHGLEGRPQDVVAGDHAAYHDYAAKLAERGFVTFAPQNIYIFKDEFRTLQRKAYPLKKTLFSIMVPQHQQITDWLQTLPFVDPERIAFYGLSYGGKSAMRIPPLVDDYCLSICSADFNEWVWKNASTDAPHSYVWTGEYEIFEFNLGGTFNYSEMAALIAPRPFMVERGHFDGVAPDETVGYEFAKVRNLYAARLGLADRCEIEWFVGPHTINGKGTFSFLHRHLNWPEPDVSE